MAATPSGLSRFMQLVNPTLALTPATRILFPKDHHASLVTRDPAAGDEAELSGAVAIPRRRRRQPAVLAWMRLPTLSPPSPPSPCLHPPTRAPRTRVPSWKRFPRFLATCSQLALAGGRPQSLYGLKRSTACHISAEATMLAVQEEALRRDGKGSGIVHLADESPGSLDAFAARLIQRGALEDAFYVLDMGTLDRLFLVRSGQALSLAP